MSDWGRGPPEADELPHGRFSEHLLFGVLELGSALVRRTSTSLPNVARVAWSALVGGLVIHGLSAFTGEQWVSSVTWTGIAAVLYLGVGATVVAYVLFFRLLDRHPAIEVTLLTYLIPIVAASRV